MWIFFIKNRCRFQISEGRCHSRAGTTIINSEKQIIQWITKIDVLLERTKFIAISVFLMITHRCWFWSLFQLMMLTSDSIWIVYCFNATLSDVAFNLTLEFAGSKKMGIFMHGYLLYLCLGRQCGNHQRHKAKLFLVRD